MLFLCMNKNYISQQSFVRATCQGHYQIPVFCVLFRVVTNLELRHVRVREIY